MKRPDPDAGRRRALYGLGAALALCSGCSVELRDVVPGPAARRRIDSPDFLEPSSVVSGGFTLAPASVMGVWQPPPGPFQPLLRPVAAAARGADLYLADAGLNAVFHYDLQRQTLRRFLSLGSAPGIRLCVLEDQTVLVLDPYQRRLTRVTRDGVHLSRLQNFPLFPGASDLAIEERSGVVWLNDVTSARLVMVRPALGALVPLPLPLPLEGGDVVAQVTSVAAGPDGMYLLDAARMRVVRVDGEGRLMQSFGELDLVLPRKLAVDPYRRVYVVDANALTVYVDGRVLVTLSPRDLGVLEIADLTVHANELAIADGRAARVHLFRILPPGLEP